MSEGTLLVLMLVASAAAAFPSILDTVCFRGKCVQGQPFVQRSAVAATAESSSATLPGDEVISRSRCGLRPKRPAKASGRIVGGREASTGEFPWQAQLWTLKSGRWKFQCGGTLINEDAVITAAHCFKHFNLTEYEIRLGRHDSHERDECGEQRVRLRAVHVHDEFNAARLSSDLALVFVASEYDQKVLFTDVIQPACLPASTEDPLYSVGSVGYVSGWGLTDEKDSGSAAKKLQWVSVSTPCPWLFICACR